MLQATGVGCTTVLARDDFGRKYSGSNLVLCQPNRPTLLLDYLQGKFGF